MSGNASRRRGRARELSYRDHLRAQGWWCERVDTPGVDLVASKPGERLHFVQVKSTVTPWRTFTPAYRATMLAEAKKAGAVCSLLWWPRGVGLSKAVWYDETEFP